MLFERGAHARYLADKVLGLPTAVVNVQARAAGPSVALPEHGAAQVPQATPRSQTPA
jgi:hypothetical protein